MLSKVIYIDSDRAVTRLNPKPQTPNSKPQARNPKLQNPNPKPQTPNPKTQTQTPQPHTPNPRPHNPQPDGKPLNAQTRNTGCSRLNEIVSIQLRSLIQTLITGGARRRARAVGHGPQGQVCISPTAERIRIRTIIKRNYYDDRNNKRYNI